jgi:hypothetical protein
LSLRGYILFSYINKIVVFDLYHILILTIVHTTGMNHLKITYSFLVSSVRATKHDRLIFLHLRVIKALGKQ